MLEIRYRGVLGIENARGQSGYAAEFGDIKKGFANLIQVYREFLTEHGD